MDTFNALPAGVRLDVWLGPTPSQTLQDAPAVAQLREEFRKSAPQFAEMLETMAELRIVRDWAGRLAAPQQLQSTIEKR